MDELLKAIIGSVADPMVLVMIGAVIALYKRSQAQSDQYAKLVGTTTDALVSTKATLDQVVRGLDRLDLLAGQVSMGRAHTPIAPAPVHAAAPEVAAPARSPRDRGEG